MNNLTKRNLTKQLVGMATLLVMLFTAMPTLAQNVTVKKSSGAAIASVPEGDSDYDTFFKQGGFATWRHNQLNLTLTTSDYPTLTANGQLANPANDICESQTLDALCLGKGNATNDFPDIQTYVTFALPKGYSFTGYEIVWARNLQDFGTGTGTYTAGNAIFGETDASFNYKQGYYGTSAYNASAPNVTIKRENIEGNVLYFRLSSQNNNGARVAITLKSVTLYFTAEADYSPLTPANLIASPVSAVDIPFPTGKVDYGPIESRYYNGVDRVSYSSANVVDLPANFTLYEAGSIEDGTHFDGTSGKVVKYQTGSISSEGSYFKAGSAPAEGQEATEQIYFIESPTYVTLPDANDTKNPVGFRIVGAKIDYTFGEAHAAGQQEVQVPHYTSYPTFYISASLEMFTRSGWGTWLSPYVYTSQGIKTYYMRSDASFTDIEAQRTMWFMDENGYIRMASNPDKYLKNQRVSGTNNRMAVVGPGDSPAKYAINGNGQITVQSNSNMYLSLNVDIWDDQYPHGTPNYFQVIQNGTIKATRTLSGNNKTVTTYTTETVNVPAFTPSQFTINLYDKTGTTVIDSMKVTSKTPDGYLFVGDLNNDAVKIGIKGVGLFKGTITLQALDPYIDQMEVVCQDAATGKEDIRMSQPFFASDFSVSGGEFDFYMPSDCVNDQVKISYENLWSHYADDSYNRIDDSEPGNSRFSFVNSEHYNQFTSDNIYNNRTEAAAGKGVVKERQIVETVGTARFHFNNADVVGTNGGTLTEYPFTQANYSAAPNSGSFAILNLTVPSTGVSTGTSYVFTTDETRYNIAPTTAVQHRAYAFYEMKINVHSSDYDPKVEIVKVYANTNYDDGSNTDADKPFYGAIITAPYGTAPNVKQGFASDYEIESAIATVISNKKDDFNHTDIPASAKQILYMDLSGLAGYYTNSQASKTINAYRNTELAPNALVFMPKGVAINDINFAYMTEGEGFRASNNIILTDKQPFFTPYDIQVPSNNYAIYSRMVTVPKNGQVTNATVLLPFKVSVTNGTHANEDNSCSFTMNTMQNGELTEPGEKEVDYGTAYFKAVSGERTEANMPYMVKVTSYNEESVDAGKFSFIVKEKGAEFVATPKTSAGLGETLFGSETSSNSFGGNSYTFTNKGTFSGKTFPRTDKIFYFANGKYLNLESLVRPTLYVYPFRSVYQYTTASTTPTNPARQLMSFNVSYDEPQNTSTGIIERHAPADLLVQTGNGMITMTATRTQSVDIRSTNGLRVDRVNLNVGDTKTVYLPAGIYIVNNAKIIVK